MDFFYFFRGQSVWKCFISQRTALTTLVMMNYYSTSLFWCSQFKRVSVPWSYKMFSPCEKRQSLLCSMHLYRKHIQNILHPFFLAYLIQNGKYVQSAISIEHHDVPSPPGTTRILVLIDMCQDLTLCNQHIPLPDTCWVRLGHGTIPRKRVTDNGHLCCTCMVGCSF